MSFLKDYNDPRWKEKQQRILNRDKKCFFCPLQYGPNVLMDVHHINYTKGLKIWECPDEDLVAVCRECHNKVEDAIRAMRALLFVSLDNAEAIVNFLNLLEAHPEAAHKLVVPP